MVRNCKSKFFSIWDVDSIVPPEQIIQSVDFLRKDEADFVSPFNDKAWDTTRILKELYVRTKDIQVLIGNIGKMNLFHPFKILFGAAIFVNRKVYLNAGMDNERCYGWGGEDDERAIRLKILGYRYKRVLGPLFHLTHERGINSKYHSTEQLNIITSELKRIQSMSKNELKDEIKTWKR